MFLAAVFQGFAEFDKIFERSFQKSGQNSRHLIIFTIRTLKWKSQHNLQIVIAHLTVHDINIIQIYNFFKQYCSTDIHTFKTYWQDFLEIFFIYPGMCLQITTEDYNRRRNHKISNYPKCLTCSAVEYFQTFEVIDEFSSVDRFAKTRSILRDHVLPFSSHAATPILIVEYSHFKCVEA